MAHSRCLLSQHVHRIFSIKTRLQQVLTEMISSCSSRELQQVFVAYQEMLKEQQRNLLQVLQEDERPTASLVITELDTLLQKEKKVLDYNAAVSAQRDLTLLLLAIRIHDLEIAAYVNAWCQGIQSDRIEITRVLAQALQEMELIEEHLVHLADRLTQNISTTDRESIRQRTATRGSKYGVVTATEF